MERFYYVKGLRCGSCEILVEKKIKESFGNIKTVKVSAVKGELMLECENDCPPLRQLDELFIKEEYCFYKSREEAEEKNTLKEIFLSAGIAGAVIIGFFVLSRFGLADFFQLGSSSSLISLFLLGLAAGVSTCAALIGSLVLAFSRQWSAVFPGKTVYQPHFLFNSGRLLSYTAFGALLGLVGRKFQFSVPFSALLIILISLLMLFWALEMLGLRFFKRFQVKPPKFLSDYLLKEKNFQQQYFPFLIGGLTFFLPCGFTVTAQSLALISGNPLQGGLIMFVFAVGTLPSLLAIGLLSVKLYHSRLASVFMKTAGVLILFFALFNVNSQLAVLGLPNLNDVSFLPKGASALTKEANSSVDNEIQVLKMEASNRGYQPNYFRVKAGIPVRWEITDKGASGCTNAVISKGLFEGAINLKPGTTSIKEFLPAKPGKYQFSCWMGMISGVIEVVE